MKFILADTEVLYDKNSKKDKMCTVYVPFNCSMGCEFCISKEIYNNGVSIEGVMNSLKSLRDSDVSEIVFTGGEPMNNLDALKEMLSIVDNKNVYINTSFFDKGSDEFIKIVNTFDCVKGVNISRHKKSFVEDCMARTSGGAWDIILLAPDEKVAMIKKPVRINIVCADEFNIFETDEYVNRWSKLSRAGFDITFRVPYQDVNNSNIHELENEHISKLTELYELDSMLYCHACDKLFFTGSTFTGNENGGYIRYHRGLHLTRIKIGTIIEMQELVMFPDGKIHTDWDGTDDGLEEFCNILKINI